ncbi:MAG: ABC transporter ATP-binding protein/permease [Acidimicrobiia bacterium]|nr:ABC transporter ATP-binding protein/permease [Acidimicrobiia bacterium]
MFHSGGWWSYIQYDEEQDRPQVDGALLRRVVQYAKPYRLKLAIVLGTILVISVLALFPPLLIRDLIDTAIPDKNIGRVTWLGLGMIAVPLVNGAIGVLQRWASAAVGEGIILDLRKQLFAHLQRMPLAFFTGTKTGELMSRLNNDVVGAQQAITGTFVTIAANVVSVTATLIIMFGIEWRLTLLAITVLPLFIIPSRRVGKVLRRLSRQSMDRTAAMSATLNETLNVSGALLVKLFGRADSEDERFGVQATDVAEIGIRRALVGRWFFMALGLVSAIGTALVFWVGARMVINDSLTVGSIVALSAYLTALYGPLSALSNARVEFATSLVSFERVFELIDLPQEIAEPEAPVELSPVVGEVTFENVSFTYQSDSPTLESVRRFSWHSSGDLPDIEQEDQPEQRRLALQNLSFSASAGQLTALVGPSGAGKTTTTYLVPRLYDVTEGRVLIDGHDVRDIGFETLSRSIGVVTQEAYLLHDTIAANLRYARPDATVGELEAACRAANIHDFIAGLANGYDTVVGERGYRLSGGEKQRVAIARVILKDPRILILDEATSHLDARSEALIQQALEHLMESRTSLVIAHRLSTILAADQILVMDQGRVVETGTHRELIDHEGLYATLYRTQFESSAVSHNP